MPIPHPISALVAALILFAPITSTAVTATAVGTFSAATAAEAVHATVTAVGERSPSFIIPPNPTDDIPWDPAQFWNIPVAEIEAAFNNGRDQEEIQLAIVLPSLTMPSQNDWDGMSDNDKALFLINEERLARAVQAFEGHDAQVTGVAQSFADWLMANDAWGHEQDVDNDGTDEDPWDRLFDDPEIAPPDIAGCHEFLSRAENLAVFVTSDAAFPPDEPVARAVYNWIYDDSGSAWGHRETCFVEPLVDNSGVPGVEGLLGMGVTVGGPYQGPFGSPWPAAVLVVHNFFDPCSTWDFGKIAVEQFTPAAVSTIVAAHPNPFNPQTHLSFDLPSGGVVELSIFGPAGQLVRELTHASLPAGRHVVAWDGRDDSGVAAPSGVYVGRLRAGGRTSATKLTLLK